MPTITTIYNKYQIMPNLQHHMFRVAGVAKMIGEAYGSQLDLESVVKACLLHDMGNIIKFDLKKFPEFTATEGVEYWQQVQNEYFAKYGFNEFVATKTIVAELGVSARVLELIVAIGFSNAEANYKSTDLEKKICDYADTRVTPQGVTSLDDRITDLEERYGSKYPSPEDRQKRKEYAQFLHLIEDQIFDGIALEPAQITEEMVSKELPGLMKTEL